MSEPILSLCLPTNGIIEWVFPVLDSIYEQKVDENLFEVVVTNNGDNEEFHILMEEYSRSHRNLLYRRTNAYMFHNQLEALKIASGQYLKLINHRATLMDGSITQMIKIVLENSENKPVMFFSNGILKKDSALNTFDEFVRELGEYASWTTGVGIWKSDYDSLSTDLKVDKISPHSCILFANRDKSLYKIYNFTFSEDIEKDHSKKGKYDLFKAFAVEELTITQNLFIDGDITASTLKKVKKDYKWFVAGLYWSFVIRKNPCSYDLTGFNDAMGIYYNKIDVIVCAWLTGVKRVIAKLGGK